jgi:hypothetical protein
MIKRLAPLNPACQLEYKAIRQGFAIDPVAQLLSLFL